MAITLNEFCAAILEINKHYTGTVARRFVMKEVESDFIDVSLAMPPEAEAEGGEYLGDDDDWVSLFIPPKAEPGSPKRPSPTFGTSVVFEGHVEACLTRLGKDIESIVAGVKRGVKGETPSFEKQRIKCLLGLLWGLFAKVAHRKDIGHQTNKWWSDIFNFIEKQLIPPRETRQAVSNGFKGMTSARHPQRVTSSLESRLQIVLNLLTVITPAVGERNAIEFPKSLVSMPEPGKSIYSRLRLRDRENLDTSFNDISLLLSTHGPAAMPLLAETYSQAEVFDSKLQTQLDLKQIYDQIMKLVALDLRGGLMDVRPMYIIRIMAILLDYDNNPCLHAFQLIREIIRQQDVYVYKKQKNKNETGMYFISTKKDLTTNHYKLFLVYSVDLVGIYIPDHGLLTPGSIPGSEPDKAPLTCTISCWINLDTFEVEPVECSVQSEVPILVKRLIHPIGKIIDFHKLKAEVKENSKGKNTFDRNNFYPLCIPLSLNLWKEYLDLQITPSMLIQHVREKDLIDEVERKATSDYFRGLTVNGKILPEGGRDGNGEYPVERVASYLKTQFPDLWKPWHQLCLNMFIAQTWINPIESVWYRFMTILGQICNLAVMGGHDISDHTKLYDLTYIQDGEFRLKGGYDIYKIYDHGTDTSLIAKERPLIRYHMEFRFPIDTNQVFYYPFAPTITISPECEQYAEKIIQALQVTAHQTREEIVKLGTTKLIESLWGEYEKENGGKR